MSSSMNRSPERRAARLPSSVRVLVHFVVLAGCVGVPLLNLMVPGYFFVLMGSLSSRSTLAEALPRVRDLGRVVWMSIKGLFGTLVLLAPPAGTLFLAWTAGWIFAYERVDPALRPVGLVTGLASILVLAPILALLPILQVRFAASGRLADLFDVGSAVTLARRRPWATLGWALLVGPYSMAHGAARMWWIENPRLVPYLAGNAALLSVYGWIHVGWVRLVRTLAADAPIVASTGARSEIAAHAMLLLPAALVTLATVVIHFLADFGWTDFVRHPLFLVPTAPYPVGWYGTGALAWTSTG